MVNHAVRQGYGHSGGPFTSSGQKSIQNRHAARFLYPVTTTSPQIDTQSSDDLIREAMPLVGHVVRSTLVRIPNHVDEGDLVGAGLVALVAAAKSYDPSRGASFHTYATNRVRGAVTDELRRADWASRSVRRRARELDELRSRFTAQLGREPSDDELAAGLGVGRGEIWKLRADLSRAMLLSLEGITINGDDVATDGRTPVAALEHRERIAYLRDAVEQLPDRLRTVVEGSFFHGRKMADLADELGVTESRVSQIRTEALGMLREALERSLDRDVAQPSESSRPGTARREAYFAAVAGHRSYLQRLSDISPLEPFTTAN
jgi:RNA polymerase sigma factor for flagellar operon FliA